MTVGNTFLPFEGHNKERRLGIYWTEAEVHAVRDEGIRLQRAGNISSISELFHLAQATVLPPDRQRKVTTTAKIQWFVSAIRAIRRQRKLAGVTKGAKYKPAATQVTPWLDRASEGEPETVKRVQWNDAEKRQLCECIARLQAHLTRDELSKAKPRDALFRAQEIVLPPERRRQNIEAKSFANWYETGMHAARLTLRHELELEAAKQETPAPAAAPATPLKPTQTPKRSIDEGRDYSGEGAVRWTTMEKARIARQVNRWRSEGDTRALSRLVIEAQELVLDIDRRRSIPSIQSGTTGGYLEKLIAHGTANEWLLPADPPPAEAEPEPQAAEPEAQAEPQQAVQAAQAPEPATGHLPPTQPPRALSAAAQAFGATVMRALDDLLAVHAQSVMHNIAERMSAMAAITSQQIAQQIEQSMRATVHKIVEAELGPVSAPAMDMEYPEVPAAPEAAAEPQPEAERVRLLKVDVVGLNNGSMEQQVKTAINGGADLRFFDPDSGTYAPHRGRHCIMITQRVPHSLKFKIKAAGISPIYVKSTAGHVIQAIEELQRAAA